MTPEHTGAARGLRRVAAVATTVEIGIACAATVLIFVLVLLQAGQRYLPFDSYTWTGELARYGLVWVTFTVAGVLVSRDGHIALQLVDSIPWPPVVRAIQVMALLVVAAVGVGFAWACWSLIQESGSLTTPALGLPVQWIYALPLVGFVSTAVRAVLRAGLVARHGPPAPDSDEDAPSIHVDDSMHPGGERA